MKTYKVTYLIDVISKNPKDYTIEEIIEAENEMDAIKKVAINMTAKDSSNIDWIKNIKGNKKELINELLFCNYVFEDAIEVNAR